MITRSTAPIMMLSGNRKPAKKNKAVIQIKDLKPKKIKKAKRVKKG